MTEITSKIQKYYLIFSKNLYFLKNGDFVENIFSCDFNIYDYSIRCATKFHADQVFFLSQLDQKLLRFCQKFVKVQLLSVIAID